MSQRNPAVGYFGSRNIYSSSSASPTQKFLSSPPPSPVRLHSETEHDRKKPAKPFSLDIVTEMKNMQDDQSSPIASRKTFTKRNSVAPKQSFAPPALSSSPELDRFVVSSTAQYTSSGVHNYSTTSGDTEVDTVKLCGSLATVLRDWRRYKRFLDLRGNDAQRLLNDLQLLLDCPHIDKQFRNILLIALIRLSRKADLYPECFSLSGVTREGEYPFSGGHFCEIYKGRVDGQLVCMKIVKTFVVSDREQYSKAFCREAVLWGQMLHPNVLPFYGIHKFGDAGNRIALVSPWLPNGTANDFLSKSPGVNRRNLVADVAAGMAYLHKNQVVHGDIKGSNVLITESGRACLTDFGLASIAEIHGAQLPAVTSSGTARFQAPELIDPNFDHPRSKSSDVYAFSMTCYQMYTGQLPFFETKRDYGVLLKVGRGERPGKPLDGICQSHGLTDIIWRLIEECWAHSPSKRPNASQIVERLQISTINDPQVPEGWGDLSPPRLRRTRDSPRLDDLEKTLGLLKTTGVFVV
ncbi:hypothetical protein H0H92_012596 [Tricholoma furcatifolium]|nr:hypothetical protein H0H92_012596 [Tricholoma furcatifolium]